jgi:hypothetical protein
MPAQAGFFFGLIPMTQIEWIPLHQRRHRQSGNRFRRRPDGQIVYQANIKGFP